MRWFFLFACCDANRLFEYNIIEQHPHDPTAFTEGFFFANGFLYESTGLEGTSFCT